MRGVSKRKKWKGLRIVFASKQAYTKNNNGITFRVVDFTVLEF